MQSIQIKKLAIDTVIGVYDHEKIIKQRLYISITMTHDLRKAMQSDNLNDTLDYAKIGQDIKEILENNAFELIERVLGVVATLLEKRYQINDFYIEVEKPGALPTAECVSVTYNKGAY